MRPIVIGSLIALLASLPALAALPPQYQRQRELLAIINDSAIVDAFGFDGIEAVERVGQDHYQVRGGTCVLDVTIKDLPNSHEAGWVGPRAFEIVFGKPTCK